MDSARRRIKAFQQCLSIVRLICCAERTGKRRIKEQVRFEPPTVALPSSQEQEKFRSATLSLSPGLKCLPSLERKLRPTPLTPNQVEITYNQFVSLGMPNDVIVINWIREALNVGLLEYKAR